MSPRHTARQPNGSPWPAFIDYVTPCGQGPGSSFDRATAAIVRAGYAAVSLLSGESLPMALMETYFQSDRASFDGVFVVRPERVDKILTVSGPLESAVAMQKKILVRAVECALADKSPTGVEDRIARWAYEIVQRLKAKSRVGGSAFEDVSTGDFAEIVEGARTSGELVQTVPQLAFPIYISFGGLRLHFEGRMTCWSQRADSVQLDLAPVIVDKFDFHSSNEDDGTGWMDHALARMQCSGEAHPFRIEGKGTPFRLTVHARKV